LRKGQQRHPFLCQIELFNWYLNVSKHKKDTANGLVPFSKGMCPKYFKVIFNVRIKQSIYTFSYLGLALTINPVDKNGILLSHVFSILAATLLANLGMSLENG
jgi:hypothetical protein